MTAVFEVQVQPPCVVCGTDRQVQVCRPGVAVGPVAACLACTGPDPIPVLVVAESGGLP